MATFIAFMAVLTCGFYAYALIRFAKEFGWKRQKATGGIVALPRSTATQRRLDYVHAAKERVRGIAARMRVAPGSAKAGRRQPRVTLGSDLSHTAREREMIVSCAIEKDWSIIGSRHITDPVSDPISRRVKADAATESAGRPGTKDAA